MRISMATCFLIPLLLALHSGAQTLTYSTFGEPGDVYNTSSGWLVNGSANPPQPYVAEAFAFTPAFSGYLSQLRLAMCAGDANLANDVANVYIAANSAQNVPGANLESFLNVPCAGIFGVDNPLISLTSTVHPLLQAGNTYWLWVQAAVPQAAIVVNQNSLGILAPQAQAFSATWLARGNKATFAFDVEVTPVPEPSSIAIAVLGMLAMFTAKAKML
jgi:hypothetical protein